MKLLSFLKSRTVPASFSGLLMLVACSVAAASPEWKLVWSDEFETAGRPDPQRWTYETGFVRNEESQIYTDGRPENARVENGMLVIEARKERFPNPWFDPAAAAKVATSPGQRPVRKFANGTTPVAEYTSASVITRGKATWKYGRIEVRARLPRGRGIWPAIWMLGANRGQVKWPDCGEIDVMEFVGFEPENIHANVHLAARYAPKLKEADLVAKGMKAMLKVPGTDVDFHVYGVEWDAERMRFFVDDTVYLTYANPHTGEREWPFDQPFYLLLNIAVGGGWGGKHGIDDSIFPQRLSIDYVRVYQREGQSP